VLHWVDTYDQMGQSVALGGGARGQVIVNAAGRWLGLPYSWGGGGTNGPSYGTRRGAGTWGFDCSGLAQYAYHQAGIDIPRTTQEGYLMPDRRRDAVRIPAGQGVGALQPGDLMYFGGSDIHHVAIYAGGGQLIEAPYTGSHVRISSASRPDYAGAVRFP
jgi:cell wall-associated NlpC family hydrolase